MDHHRPISFHEDIITEILSYLPVKSLVRFKTINKSWNKIISSPYFTKLHLLNYYHNNINKIKSCPKFSPDPECLNKTLDQKNNTHPPKIKIAGPAGDRICIYGVDFSQRIAIFDLSNRKTELLPPYPTPEGYSSATHTRSIGFGLTEYGFVVVQLLSYVGPTPEPDFVDTIRADAYISIRNISCWRQVNCDFGDMVIKKAIASTSKVGVFCYWLAHDGYGLFVLSYDCRDASLERTPLPRCFDDDQEENRGKKIKILTQDDVSLVLFSYSELVLEMWVLYGGIGVGAEWTKLGPIGPLLHVSKPVASWEHRGVVLKYGREGKYMVFYDYTAQELRITDIPNRRNVKVLEYDEDLISLDLSSRYQSVLGSTQK